MDNLLTENREIATAVGLAGSVESLARRIEQAPNTLRRQVKRGALSPEIAQLVAAQFDLDLAALVTKPNNAGTPQS